MKVTFYEEYQLGRNYRDEFDLEISDSEYELIVARLHPDYDDLEEWAQEQASGAAPSRQESYGDLRVWDGDSGVTVVT
jgi:hypothetical protein